MENLYSILGISKDATPEQIKTAYRKKALETHPDRNNGDDDQFRKVDIAYNTLINPKTREYYDETGRSPEDGFSDPEMFVLSLLESIIEKTKPSGVNYISKANDQITDRIGTAELRLIMMKKAKNQLQELMPRVSSTHSVNLFAFMVKKKITSVDLDIERQQNELAMLTEARKILQAHKDATETVPEAPAPMKFFTMGRFDI